MASATTTNVGEMFKQGLETFEAAMKAAVKIQEESTQRFTEMLQEMGSPAQWQKKFQAAMDETVMMTQKHFDEGLNIMNQNAHSVLELFQKALQMTPAQQGAEAETKYRDLWESALGTMRKNTEVILQANTRMTESWTELAKKVSGQMEELTSPEEKHG
jgi:hypothetical protein